MKKATMIIKAEPGLEGYVLTAYSKDNEAEPVFDHRPYQTRSQAYADCEIAYPANSTWQGRKVKGGYRIVTD